jgi:hypothetical protein
MNKEGAKRKLNGPLDPPVNPRICQKMEEKKEKTVGK